MMLIWIPSLPRAGSLGARLRWAAHQLLTNCQRLRPALGRRQAPRAYARSAIQEAEVIIAQARAVMRR